MKIGIVTDSTADIPQELVREYGIEIVPLQVSIDNKSYRDGVDLTATEFYQKLQVTKSQPVTSQPAPGLFIDCYRKLLKKVDAIVSIHLTEKFSGTVRNAHLAREMFPGTEILVIDSQSTSMGLGSQVLEVARAIQRGVKLDQIMTLVHQLQERMHFLLILDTLEFLRRGGRATKLQVFLSSILQIKPLLKVDHGVIELVTKVRSRGESIKVLIEEFKKQVALDSKSIISIIHTASEQEALKLKTMIQETFHHAEIIINQAGPVLGTHVGPGALALVYLPKV